MPRKHVPHYVLDSGAILAIPGGEPGKERVRAIAAIPEASLHNWF